MDEQEAVVELRARRSGRLVAKIKGRRWLEIKVHGRFEVFDLAQYVVTMQHRRPPAAPVEREGE